MNAFETLAPPNPFEAITSEPDVPLVGDAEPSRTARLAAMAAVPISEEGQAAVRRLDGLTAMYKDRINTGGDESVRREFAADQLETQVKALTDLHINDPQAVPLEDVVAATERVVQHDIGQRAEYAMEQKVVENIQDLAASGDYTQAELLYNNLVNGGPEDVYRDSATKRLIMRREIEKAQISKDDQTWFSDMANFVVGILPMNYSLSRHGLVDLAGIQKNWYDNLLPGNRQNAESGALWDLPPEQFARVLRDEVLPALRDNSTLLGYTDKTEYLSLLSEMEKAPNSVITNLISVADNIGAVPSLKAIKGMTDLPSLLISSGARKEAGVKIADTVLDMSINGSEAAVERHGLTEADVVANLVPSAVNPAQAASTVPVSTTASSQLERGRQLLKEFPDLLGTSRFANDTEFQKAVESRIATLEAEFGDNIKDIKVNGTSPKGYEDLTLESGEKLVGGSRVHGLQITIGKETGSDGFTTAEAAQRHVNSLGYPSAEIVKDESGQFFAVIQSNIPETGFYTNTLNPSTDTVFGRVLKSARLVSDNFLANLGQSSGNAYNKIIKSIVQPYEDKFTALRGHERESLRQVLAKGNNESKWYTEDQINQLMRAGYNRDASRRELDAYQAYRDINDIEFTLRNDDRYKHLVTSGFETVSFDSPLATIKETNARIARDFEVKPGERFYNASKNTHHTTGLSTKEIEHLKAEGYIVIRTEEAQTLRDGTRINAFIVKRKDLNIQPLRRDQLGYREGGHRMYSDKHFVKQAVKRQQPDTLESFYDNPHTHITGTRKETEYWAAKMERARQEYLDMIKDGGAINLARLDKVFDGEAGFPDAAQFVKGIEDGVFDKDHSFKSYYDREMPDEYGESSLFVSAESGSDQYLRSTGRMYDSPKGEALKDWKGNLAPTLDPYQTINKALLNVANITSFSDYKATAVERWVKTFGKYTNMSHLDPANSQSTVFREGLFKPGTPDRIKQAAQGQREVIQRTIGWKTETDMHMEQLTRRMSDFVFRGEAGSTLAKAERVVTDWWGETNPIQALRGAAFDMKLGMFNISQLPLQISTMAASIALSPIHGMHGAINMMPLRVFLTKGGNEAMLDTLVQRGVHTASGFKDPKEFKEFMWTAKKSGFFDFSVSHSLINDYGPNAALSTSGNAVENFRQAGRFFFNEPETWNRAVGMHIAWKETREQFPELSTKSPEFLQRMQGRAEEYSLSMSKQSEAWWQKGVLSIPTQFWAYNARMFEAMFGKTFSLEQRLRLMVTQTLLYGSGGVPFVSFLTERLKNGDQPDLDTFWGAADRGLLDEVIHGITGADIVVGGKFATGTWMSNLFKDLAGLGEYGPRSAIDIAGGATFSIFGSAGKTLYDVIHYAAAESGGDTGRPMTLEALKGLAANISTVSNALKANTVFQYGTWKTNSGSIMASGLPTANGLAALFGFQPGAQLEVSARMSWSKDRSKRIKEAAKVISNYRTRMLTEPDHIQELADQINIFTRTLPEDIRTEAIRQAGRSVDPSLYESLERRVRQQKATQ